MMRLKISILSLNWVGSEKVGKFSLILLNYRLYYTFIHFLATGGKFQLVPKEVFEEAEKYAKVRTCLLI